MSFLFEFFLLNINHERIKAMRRIVKTRWVLLFMVLLCGLGLRAQSWETIGAPGISSGAVSFTSIAVKNGTPYVAYKDETNSSKAAVKKFGTPSVPMKLKFITSSDGRSIKLPLYGSVNCTVDWGDGSSPENYTTAGLKSHTFITAGTYIVSISGSLGQFGYYDLGNEIGWRGSGYLTEVIDFGDIGLTSLAGAFSDADNLSVVPTTLLSSITDLSYCFYLNSRVSITNLNSWDLSHVTNMLGAFYEASAFNQDISGWDVGNVTDMENLFKRAYAFNQPIGTWDVGSVTIMEDMFRDATAFNQPIGSWDVSSVTTMEGMFESSSVFNQNLAGWDISSVTSMEDMFANVTLSTANYDAILTAWALQTVQPNVLFSAGNSKYSAGAAATARASLINDDNWTITDGGMNVITYTWNGSVSSDWNTAANWDLNTVPGATDDVVITNTGTAPMLSASAQVSCNALTVNSSASLTISSGGSLIANSSSGTVIVKRTLSGTNQHHFISSPVNDADLSTVFDASLHDKIYLRRYDEPSGNWMNITIPTSLSNGVGYSYYRSVVKVVSTLATFTGSLITSDVTPSISNNGPAGNDQYKGYNLIGNPYTSAIKWGQGNWNLSNVDDAVYVWSNGVYKSYVGGVGALTNGVIPAQQGFFVKANGASPSITIPSASRVHNTQAFYKNSVANTLQLEVASSVNDYVDATFIRFAPKATALFDNQLDAYKLENDAEAPMIYTNAGEDLLSVNSLPSSTQYSEIVVSFTAGVNGRYSITASGMESFGNSNIVLMDMLTNTTQNLALNPIYSFDGKIMVQLPEVTKAEAIITNMAGQVVASHFINAVGLIELPVSVSSGIYVVSVKGQAGIVTRKVFVR
jgi:surface protein